MFRVGIAGWSVPAAYRRADLATSHLEQYATYFDCVEINSTFRRPHRITTFARWAACVPPGFRFAVKLPKIITHDRRLISCDDAVIRFCGTVAGLGEKLEVLLVQLPPSLVFDEAAAEATLGRLRNTLSVKIVCETRHLSWFNPHVDRFLSALGITRVFADPPIAPSQQQVISGGSFSYLRLHGQPRTYYSPYSSEFLAAVGCQLEAAAPAAGAWCIFDNTVLGAAWPNALEIKERLAPYGCATTAAAPADRPPKD